jgi:hypothetical protein
VADTIEHEVAPALYVLDWLLFVPKGYLKFRSALVSIAFPMAYGAYSLIQGALTEFYPYPFLDVSKLGYERVLINMTGLFVVFAGLGLLLIAIGRGLGLVEARRGARVQD